MARVWWQFKNWPDGTSGTNPDIKGLDPNAVEIWPPNTYPNPCTIFRSAWLNQFLAWKYYLQHYDLTVSFDTRTWIKAHETCGPWSDPVNRRRGGLQNPVFWIWLGMLSKKNLWYDGYGSHAMYDLPSFYSPLEGESGEEDEEEYEEESGGYGFVANTAFDAIRKRNNLGEVTEMGLPQSSAEPDWYILPHNNIQARIQAYLRMVRERWERCGVFDTNPWVYYEPIGGRRDRVHVRESGTERWKWTENINRPAASYPFPAYDNGNYNYESENKDWESHTRSEHPYNQDHIIQLPNGGTWTSHDSGWGLPYIWAYCEKHVDDEGKKHGARAGIVYITDFDVFLLSDTNYRYAIVSYGSGEKVGGGYAMPPQCGYCHAVFDLRRDIDLDNPPSRIIPVSGLGNGDYAFVQQNRDFEIEREFGIVSFPYDTIPDDYKGPDWPTVDGEDEDGNEKKIPYLSNDRHNRWLDSHQPQSRTRKRVSEKEEEDEEDEE